jgi:hypothetical protein
MVLTNAIDWSQLPDNSAYVLFCAEAEGAGDYESNTFCLYVWYDREGNKKLYLYECISCIATDTTEETHEYTKGCYVNMADREQQEIVDTLLDLFLCGLLDDPYRCRHCGKVGGH